MKLNRLGAFLVIIAVAAFALAGCVPTTTTSSETSSTASPGNNPDRPFKVVNKDTIYLHTTQTYDAANFPLTSMTGEPSDIPFFKPTKDEGILNRDYPTYDKKTFKFLSLTGGTLPPAWYYMFDKNGGALNKAVAKTGYKFASIFDEGHIKILPNLYLGYYDFAWIPLNVLTEYWSGNESMNQELWREGNDYVIVGGSYDGGISLLAPTSVTSVQDLAGKSVGIMNPAFNIEAMFNKTLESVGMATASAGGNVSISMASPGFVLDDLLATKNAAVFAWGIYAGKFKGQDGYHELVNWQDMGYGKKVPYYVLVARKDIVAKHPDIVQTVVQQNIDATKLALASSEETTPTLDAYNAFKTKYMGATPAATPALVLPDAQADPTFLHDVVDYMTKCGYFKVPYTYNDLVNETFYNKATK